jgi:hypothetical protein
MKTTIMPKGLVEEMWLSGERTMNEQQLNESGYYDDPPDCPSCDGKGWILNCCDDICHDLGHCIHGDGEDMCAYCNGSGIAPSR